MVKMSVMLIESTPVSWISTILKKKEDLYTGLWIVIVTILVISKKKLTYLLPIVFRNLTKRLKTKLRTQKTLRQD